MSNIIKCEATDIADRFTNIFGGLIIDCHEFIGIGSKEDTMYEIVTYMISDYCFVLINYIFGGQLFAMRAYSPDDIVICLEEFNRMHNGNGVFYMEV